MLRGMRKERRTKMKGRISRIGSYAISSSVKDNQQRPCITCTTFNILAPIYKRLNHEVRFLFFIWILFSICVSIIFNSPFLFDSIFFVYGHCLNPFIEFLFGSFRFFAIPFFNVIKLFSLIVFWIERLLMVMGSHESRFFFLLALFN